MRPLASSEPLTAIDPELTIYAAKPWTPQSDAMLAHEPASGGVPEEAKRAGRDYFIEAFVAHDFLKDISAPAQQRCDRLIHYAIYDA